jgi:uncharacterized protein YbbC (DUF1343 family)
MGGVAGHAGVFSTAHDVSLFATALLEKLLHNSGPFPLKQSTLKLMTQPEEPGRAPGDLAAANAAEQRAIAAGEVSTASPLLAPHYPAIKGKDLRGFGWDIDTAFSKPRGRIFPIGSFGHTGFTGTTLWMDPASNTYIVLLSNAIHPRGATPISNLRGEVATAAAVALGLSADDYRKIAYTPTDCDGTPTGPPITVAEEKRATDFCSRLSVLCDVRVCAESPNLETQSETFLKTVAFEKSGETNIPQVLTGIDVLESTHFAALNSLHHIAVLTNQNGLDSNGKRTIDVLHSLTTSNLELRTIFTPEHGLSGALDQNSVANTTDAATHLPVISLYGPKDSDKRPSHDQLKDLDAVVIDLQDAGVPFWTYESVLGYFLEAASREQTEFHHPLQIIVLDRPNPVGGLAAQGPIVDVGRESYVAYTQVPVRHGLTFGELARYIVAAKHLDAKLTVVPMQNWNRAMFWADTGLPWVNPSPNLRSPAAAILYPAIGLIETTNISVGRGTSHPFSYFGAPYINASDVTAALTARNIPGVNFTAATEAIIEDANHYPFHGQTIPAVRVTATDPAALDTPELGIEILSTLHRLYPTQFLLEKSMTNLVNRATVDSIARGDDPRSIAASWQTSLAQFKAACAPILIYK